jgi:hypothetical protein
MENFMKATHTLYASLAALFVAFATPASACSYYINELAEKNDLMAAVASNLNVSVAEVESIEITNYSFFESISTPMCPEEITHLGTVEISYVDPTTQYNCHAVINVTKKDNWKSHLETLEFVGQPTCRT